MVSIVLSESLRTALECVLRCDSRAKIHLNFTSAVIRSKRSSCFYNANSIITSSTICKNANPFALMVPNRFDFLSNRLVTVVPTLQVSLVICNSPTVRLVGHCFTTRMSRTSVVRVDWCHLRLVSSRVYWTPSCDVITEATWVTSFQLAT